MAIHTDVLDESNRGTQSENGHNLPRILPEESGEGLPYAPVGWPCPGDIWGWRVGKRVTNDGYFVDRYLFLPRRLRNSENATKSASRKYSFASKLALQRYIKDLYPNADFEAFSASFSWKIPAANRPVSIGQLSDSLSRLSEEMVENAAAAADTGSDVSGCRAGNRMCCSLDQEKPGSVASIPCELCCIDPLFCSHCSCLLCRKIINPEFEAYTYVKCEAKEEEDYICGHIGHIECARQCFLVGKVGGIFDLDAEYMCRRCDAKTDLIPHAAKVFEACKSITVRDDIKELLNVGICILHGSEKESAKVLLSNIELAMRKIDCGTPLEDIWKEKNASASNSAGVTHCGTALVVQSYEDPNIISNLENDSVSPDFKSKYESFETEVDDILRALKNAQRSEYSIAEEKLKAQKDRIYSLFQELDRKRSELGNGTSDDSMLSAIFDRVDQVKQEINKLRDMEEVANGFASTSSSVLRKHFDLSRED